MWAALVVVVLAVLGVGKSEAAGIDTPPAIDVTAARSAAVGEFCPVDTLQERGADFAADGVILTAFDWRATWHFDVVTGRRYPIPDTAPCGRNCHLSPDGTTISYFNDLTNAHNIMRLDGANKTFLTTNAIDVQWWDEETYFAWTPGLGAFTLRGNEREDFDVRALIAVQPGGEWGISVRFDGEAFQRGLVRIGSDEEVIALAEDIAYYNNFGWSPDGESLAYVAPKQADDGVYTSELYLIDMGETAGRQISDFEETYGLVRINGVSVNDLAWSPDGRRIAFWVVETPLDSEGDAMIHIYDRETDTLTAYCGFSTTAHTPNTPHLAWSPDGEYLGFAADVDDDGRGAWLLALEIESGVYTILSEGVYGAYGLPDVYLWGRKP